MRRVIAVLIAVMLVKWGGGGLCARPGLVNGCEGHHGDGVDGVHAARAGGPCGVAAASMAPDLVRFR